MAINAKRSFQMNILKIYGLVYSLVAIPMAYYGLQYVKLLKTHLYVSLSLIAVVMSLSVLAAFTIQRMTNKSFNRVLAGEVGSENLIIAIKKNAYSYPLRLVLVMFTGWTLLMDLIVIIPLYLIYSGSLSDVLISNLLILACGLLSVPMTYFITEHTAGIFLAFPQVKNIPEPKRVFQLSLKGKILIVCLIIITTLIIYTLASMLLSLSYNLPQTETLINLLIVSVVGVIGTIIISLLFARSLKTPIAHLNQCTSSITKGDLTVKPPRLSNDELGEISTSFDSFINHLRDIIQEIQFSVHQTGTDVSLLQKAMGTTEDSVEQINQSSEKVSTSIQKQSGIITEVSTITQQIVRTIENQDNKINQQAESVTESSTAIEQMIANIQSIAVNLQHSSKEFEGLQLAISNGSANIEELKNNVEILSSQSDKVYEANNIITNIAAQTNLLAMNAAIEAAHAGESGKGFAVVADEIRKLAEESNRQSKLISQSLKELKVSIEQSVKIAVNTGTSFDAIIHSVKKVDNLELEIKNAIDEQSSGSTQILQSLTSMNAITTEVHSGSNEMLKGSQTTLNEIGKLLEITKDVKQAAENVVEKARLVKKNSEDSTVLLNKNRENMQEIKSLVDFFRIKD